MVPHPSAAPQLKGVDRSVASASTSSKRSSQPAVVAARSSEASVHVSYLSKYTDSSISQTTSAKLAKPTSNEQTKRPSCWLTPGLRVKFVHRSQRYPELYLKKGLVLDVYGEDLCSVQFDGKTAERLQMRHLETVVPQPGQSCLVLTGVHRHKAATVLERNQTDSEVTLQLVEEPDVVLRVGMDDVCAYDESILFQ